MRIKSFWILFLLVFLIPPAWYFSHYAGAPALSPLQALDLLRREKGGAVLVDIRPEAGSESGMIGAAVRWPWLKLQKDPDTSKAPEGLEGKTLLIICQSGIRSAQAVRILRKAGWKNIYHVRGGVQRWSKTKDSGGGAFPVSPFRPEAALAGEKKMSFFHQLLAVAAGFFLKPMHMLLSFLIILALWKNREADLRALRWGLFFFLAGEGFCAINYLFFRENSCWAEYLHSTGMIIGFSLTLYAIFEGADRRILHLQETDKTCAFSRLCALCYKNSDVSCRARILLLFFIPALMIVAFIPLVSAISRAGYTTVIFGTLYTYVNPVLYQLFEFRFCPLAAQLFFMIALGFLLTKEKRGISQSARSFMAAGLGLLSFSFLRLLLRLLNQDNLMWASFWEEMTEWLFLAGTALVLWLFRGKLGIVRESFKPPSHP